MRKQLKRCACGLPLHYTDKNLEAEIIKLTDELGEWMPLHLGNDKYLVQRHYVALHGFKPPQLPDLLAQGIIRYA